MRLTLGALAMLEGSLKAGSMSELFQRFASETFRADDLILVLQAGLYGAGNDDIDVAAAKIDGGASAAAKSAIHLLKQAFG
jgi:hypothetical protein